MASNDTSAIGRRQLLSSAAVIGASSTAAGVGTWSLFADEAETRGRVRAGTLELSTTEGSAASITISPTAPGDEGIEAVELVNGGSVPGDLRLTVDEIDPAGRQTGRENGQSAGARNGDLGDAVTAEIGFTDDPSEVGSTLFGPSRLDEIHTGRTVEADRTLAPVTDGTDRATTFLFVAWKASDELEDADGDGCVAIELRPELRT